MVVFAWLYRPGFYWVLGHVRCPLSSPLPPSPGLTRKEEEQQEEIGEGERGDLKMGNKNEGSEEAK